MLFLPDEPEMLVSVINMKLRDDDITLRDLLEDSDYSEEEIIEKLAKAGFKINADTNQFR